MSATALLRVSRYAANQVFHFKIRGESPLYRVLFRSRTPQRLLCVRVTKIERIGYCEETEPGKWSTGLRTLEAIVSSVMKSAGLLRWTSPRTLCERLRTLCILYKKAENIEVDNRDADMNSANPLIYTCLESSVAFHTTSTRCQPRCLPRHKPTVALLMGMSPTLPRDHVWTARLITVQPATDAVSRRKTLTMLRVVHLPVVQMIHRLEWRTRD